MAETTKPYPSPEKLSEQLINLCWRIAVELRAIYNTVQTKISQSDADKLYLGIKGKAVSATTADSATKATQDGSGNVITQTYAKVSAIPSAMTGATASVAGTGGTVPAPAAGANAKYLRGDGTWQVPTNTTYNVMTAASASAAGAAGLVPAPAAGKQAQYLRGDGTWATPTNTTYNVMTAATASAAGKAGLVPQPSAGANAKFLRGDGTWQTVLTSQTKADWNATSGDGVINNKPSIPTKLSDLKDDLLSAYLPLTGGTVTGDLTTNGTFFGTRIQLYNGVNNNVDFFTNDGTGGGYYLAGDDHTSGDWVQILTANSAGAGGTCPPGTMVAYAGTSVPSGWLLCNGAAISRTTYKNLFSAIGVVWGSGDGSTTFNLPNLDERYFEVTTASNVVGQTAEAQLPNIRGGTGASLIRNGSETDACWGAMSYVSSYSADIRGGTGWWASTLQFYANLDNSTYNRTCYGEVGYVRPKSFRAFMLIKW